MLLPFMKLSCMHLITVLNVFLYYLKNVCLKLLLFIDLLTIKYAFKHFYLSHGLIVLFVRLCAECV